jgi:hypothetical protein
MKTPLESVCSKKYRATKTSGTRNISDVRWIVVHAEQASTAESSARYFSLPTAEGSAHLCVDDDICYRTLENNDVPWAAPGANTRGFHIEQAAFSKWDATAWLRHRDTLKRAAYKAALHCRVFGLPVVWVNAAGLRAGRNGITTHAECTKAFGGDHTDPGIFWPRRYFMSLARNYYDELGV